MVDIFTWRSRIGMWRGVRLSAKKKLRKGNKTVLSYCFFISFVVSLDMTRDQQVLHGNLNTNTSPTLVDYNFNVIS